MSKVDQYRAMLRTLDSWDPFLLRESRLPGPRGNLELAFAVAMEGDESLFLRYASLDADSAPVNSPQEFLAFCGVLGLGYLVAQGQRGHLPALRASASDPRWRTREAVALGLQRYGHADMGGLLEEMESWAAGSLFERRAVVAALCEPDLLRDPRWAGRVFDLLDRITSSVMEEADRRADGFRVLRQALGYGWSVAVAAQPEIGKPRMEAWVGTDDRDVRWIVRQNLKKARLSRMDAGWVGCQLARVP